jgi:hypothetical protein
VEGGDVVTLLDSSVIAEAESVRGADGLTNQSPREGGARNRAYHLIRGIWG